MGRGDEEEEYFTKRRVTKIIQEKENLLKKITKNLETTPEGTLKYQTRSGVTYYYLQKKNPETKKWEKTYLKKSQTNLIKQLAQKAYLQKAKRVLEEQVSALTYFASVYDETYEPYDAYSEYKIYETDRGEMVRSKSEIIIHPDFTIINKHTGKRIADNL